METWGSKYLGKIKLATCGTCGNPLMPPDKLLDAFFDFLKKQGVILPPEKRWKAENYDKLQTRIQLLEENLAAYSKSSDSAPLVFLEKGEQSER